MASCGSKFGNFQHVKIGVETTYGTLSTELVDTNFKATGEKTRALIDSTSQKKGAKENQFNFNAGLKGGTFEISGDVDDSDGMRLLIKSALGLEVGTPVNYDDEYKITNEKALPFFSIQVKNVSTRDEYLGCIIQNLTITGTSGSMLTFTATGRCKDVNMNIVDVAAVPSYQNLPRYSFDQMEIVAANTATTATAMTLTVDNTLISDEISYRNSLTRICDGKETTNAQLQLTLLAGEGDDSTIFNNLGDPTQLSLDRILFAGTNELHIDVNGFYATSPESGDDVIVVETTKTIVDSYNSSAVGLLIGFVAA